MRKNKIRINRVERNMRETFKEPICNDDKTEMELVGNWAAQIPFSFFAYSRISFSFKNVNEA